MDIDQKLKNIFTSSFRDLDKEKINEAKRSQVKSWDSLGHLSLVSAIEQDFNLQLSDDDVVAMNSYSEAFEIISKKLAIR